MAVRNLEFRLSGKDAGAGRAFSNVEGKASRLGNKLGSVAGGFIGGGLFSAVQSFGTGSVEAFKGAEQSAAALDQAFQKFPKLADSSAASFGKLNEQLAKKTKFDDDALSSGQATLAQFNLTGKQIEQVTPLLADYAAKTGQDLPSAAQALGKAFSGNAKALKGIGINYKSTGDAGKDFENIQAALNGKVGGFAESEGKTAAGQAEILKNQFGEVQEEIGSKLVPALVKMSEKLLEVIGFVQRNSKVIVPLVATIGAFAAIVWTVNKAVKAYTAVQAALNAVMLMNPIGLVVLAIAGLVTALVIAYKKSETFRNIVNAAFNGLKTVVMGVIKVVANLVLGWFDLLINGAAKAFGWVPGIGGKLKTAAEEFGKFRDRVNRSLSGIQDKEITLRITKVGTGTQELDRIADEKAARRNRSTTGTAPRNVTANLQVNLNDRVLARSTETVLAGNARRGDR